MTPLQLDPKVVDNAPVVSPATVCPSRQKLRRLGYFQKMKVFDCPDKPGVCKLVSNAKNWRFVNLAVFDLVEGQNLPSVEEALKIWRKIDLAGFDNPINGEKVFDSQYFAEVDKRSNEAAEAQRVAQILKDEKIKQNRILLEAARARFAPFAKNLQVIVEETKKFDLGKNWPESCPTKWRIRDFRALRKFLGERCFRAVSAKPPTLQRDAEKMARKFKRTNHTLSKTCEKVQELAAGLMKSRNARRRVFSLYPKPTLAQRLAHFKQEKAAQKRSALTRGIKNAIARALNAVRSHREEVRLLPNNCSFDEINAKAWLVRGEKYSRSCRYSKTYASFSVSVHENWNETVEGEGLAEVGGLVTLAAEKLLIDNGLQIWRAKWAAKSIGFSFAISEGFIAKDLQNGELTHGKTVAICKATLTRRATAKRLQKAEKAILARLGSFSTLGAAGEVLVTSADSRRAGNCEAGTKAFADRFFPGQSQAPIREVLAAAEKTSERQMAISACLYAIKRQRKLALALAQ